MALIPCPACERMISREAEACPQCGHPNRRGETEAEAMDFSQESSRSSGPRCYACSALATTKCQGCGTMSCVVHVNPVYVPHGRGGANELRCQKCRDSLFMWKVIGYSLAGMLAIGMLIFFLQKRAEFNAKFNDHNFPQFNK